MRLFLDTEARLGAAVGLGPRRAVEGARLLVIAWQLGADQQPRTWREGEPHPAELLALLADPRVAIVAHNAAFDAVMLERLLPGCPPLDLARLDCTAARAAVLGLPAGLEAALVALGAPQDARKDTLGGEILRLFVAPPRGRAPLEPSQAPEAFQRVVDYCAQDLRALVWLDDALPPLSDFERKVWLAHARINARGVCIDSDLARAIVHVGGAARSRAELEFRTLTQGVGPRSHAAARAWFAARCPRAAQDIPASLAKDTLPRWRALLAGDALALRALGLRAAASSDPGTKARKILDQVCSDGRVRDLFRYCATQTRRFASGADSEASGSGANVQNLHRGDGVTPRLAALIRRALLDGVDAEGLDLLADNVATALSAVVRHIFVPAQGQVFLDHDYTAIEPRVAALLAGHDARLEKILNGTDLYKEIGAAIFHVPVADVDKRQRHVGKTTDLSSGYGVGAARLLAALTAAGIEADRALADRAITAWRRSNLPIVRTWFELLSGFGHCTREGTSVPVAGGRARFERDANAVRLVLPSGGSLFYHNPAAVRRHDGGWDVSYTRAGAEQPTHLHGGMLLENLVSGAARDVLCDALVRADADGLGVVLHVHDQIVAEHEPGAPDHLARIMNTPPAWAEGWPIAATGGATDRFTKD